MIGSLLQQYASGGSSDAPHEHFDQVARQVDQPTLASGIGAMMRSPETPSFSQIVGQLFHNGNGEQKASMLNTLLAGGAPGVLGRLSSLLPGFSGSGPVSPTQAQQLPPDEVKEIAAQAEQHNPSIVDRMSSVYAAHPDLVKALGTGAMIVALREIGKRYQ